MFQFNNFSPDFCFVIHSENSGSTIPHWMLPCYLPVTSRTKTTVMSGKREISVSSTFYHPVFRNTGIDWERVENGEGNVFFETNLSYGEKTELFFKNTITPPDLGIACLDFKYRKFSKGRFEAGDTFSNSKVDRTHFRWTENLSPGGCSIFEELIVARSSTKITLSTGCSLAVSR